MIINKCIFEKELDGHYDKIRVSKFEVDLLSTDYIVVEHPNRFDDNENTFIAVYRDIEETPEEIEERELFWKNKREESKKERYEQYLKLKKEFDENMEDNEYNSICI
jgi:hypothetical protein